MVRGSRAGNEGNGKDVVDMGLFGRGKVEIYGDYGPACCT